MSKQFVMTLKVPLPDDIFEHATVMTSIKEVLDTLTEALKEHVSKFDVKSDVILSRPKRATKADA